MLCVSEFFIPRLLASSPYNISLPSAEILCKSYFAKSHPNQSAPQWITTAPLVAASITSNYAIAQSYQIFGAIGAEYSVKCMV